MDSCFAKSSPNLRPRQVPNYTNAKQSSHSGVSEINYNARFTHFAWKEEQPIGTNSNNCPAGPVSQYFQLNQWVKGRRRVWVLDNIACPSIPLDAGSAATSNATAKPGISWRPEGTWDRDPRSYVGSAPSTFTASTSSNNHPFGRSESHKKLKGAPVRRSLSARSHPPGKTGLPSLCAQLDRRSTLAAAGRTRKARRAGLS